MYHVTKHYGHDLGLSAAFRQHRADSHCHFIHGYALAFTLEFEAPTLNENNWVIDFGALKPIKQYLVDLYDHKFVVAIDDPDLRLFEAMGAKGLAEVIILERVGCESFAEITFKFVQRWLSERKLSNHPRITKVTVAEHGGNSASYSALS